MALYDARLPMDATLSLRVGIAASFDPRDVHADSGAASSVLAAMDEIVTEAVPLSGALPPRLRRMAHLLSVAPRLRARDLRDPRAAARHLHSAAQLGRPTIAARNRLMRRRIAAAGRLDGIVQRGCEMLLPPGQRFVTYEDSTVPQALSYPWPHLRGLSEADVRRYEARQRRCYAAAIACCACTHWAAESIVDSYGVPPERVFVVGLGQNHPPADRAVRDWGRPRYLFVGVDWARKNGPAVVSAFTRVRETHTDARLDIVGGHPRVDVAGVVGHGPLSRTDRAQRELIASLFSEATAFVMPSLHEPAGIVYVEAGAAGVPSIGGSDGGAATMIGPGGLVVDPRDPERIYTAMLELADPQTAQRLGDLARAHASLFTWPKVTERLLRALAIPGVEPSALAEFL
jgi:glycosyltransferase involved in cell wall biosynthesis